ncbi:MAG: hypothetical protein GWO07_00410 [Candidatus Dadabacteria bacterium]|nr:hypothetical protein [Candidatus Dadabacteria bacterium]NIS07243.1 hypothetical protein [Candidatus Dadabacteria bacterium]NIV40950.1 hypothetical protein [Candidatus Dadabacteria bacterium]NIX14382.1 hypothetical protein [Candidatus Dadabacteria bacterium]NIY20900.1 hypothetical protein [Candidatus Dadabacteria bacterium]
MGLFNKLIKIFIIFQSVIILSCTVGDDNPPTGDTVITLNSTNRTIEFIAPGDDGTTGLVTIYDLRFFDEFELAEILGSSVDNVPFSTIQQTVQSMFGSAIQIQGEELPQPAGTSQSIFIPRLDLSGETRYYLSLVARDEVGNQSSPSNVVETNTGFLNASFVDDSEGSCFGQSMASGKIDEREDRSDNEARDGDDVVIGDPCKDTVYVFFGGKDFGDSDANSDGIFNLPSPDTADITIMGVPGTMFGASVEVVRNIDGDNSEEIVIGAPGFDSNRGRVFIIFGDQDGLPQVIDFNSGFTPDITINGEAPGDNFGLNMIAAIGITGSNSDSLIIGAPTALSNRGKAYFYREGDIEDLNRDEPVSADTAKAIFTGEDAGDLFGSEITEVGIIDNNDRSDFAISSPGAARVYVFFVPSDVQDIDLSTDTSRVVILQGDTEDEFGAAIGGDGDYDGDPEDDEDFGDIARRLNREDVLIGAPGFDGGRGRVLFYSGFDIDEAFDLGTSPAASKEITGLVPGGRFGEVIHDMGDLNPDLDPKNRSGGTILEFDDNNEDFVVSAPGDGMGKVFLFLGSTGFPDSQTTDDAALVFTSPQGASNFGSVLENLGDINEDELNDIGIGEDSGAGVLF